MTQFNTDTFTWGGVQAVEAVHINVTLTSSNTSGSSDLSQHPSFSVKPVWYCSNPNNLTPLSHGLYIVSTPAELADSLLSIAANVARNPAGVLATLYGFPTLVILAQDMSINDVVQLAASQSVGVGLSVPLILISATYPLEEGVLVPPSVTLDLSGCIGCVSLMGHARLYLSNLHLTGLQRPGPSNGSSGSSSSSGNSSSATGDGSDLSLPLWSFQFHRSSSTPAIMLYNVTLTLAQVPPPYTLHHTPHTTHPTPHTPYTLHPAPHITHPRAMLHPTPHTLHPIVATPCTLQSRDCFTLHPAPYTLHPSNCCTLQPTPQWLLHPAPCTVVPAAPCTLHPTPYTLHPEPYSLHPTPYTLHPTPRDCCTLHPPQHGLLHPTPYTLYLAPQKNPNFPHITHYTSHPTPHTLHPAP